MGTEERRKKARADRALRAVMRAAGVLHRGLFRLSGGRLGRSLGSWSC